MPGQAPLAAAGLAVLALTAQVITVIAIRVGREEPAAAQGSRFSAEPVAEPTST